MDDLYKLRLTGITYNQIESGAYALVLEEETSGRRLPIIIGYPEAQAIECKLQEIKTPRPLTHDLMTVMLDAFDIKLKNVVIRKLPNGVFAADLTLESGGTIRTIDSRSSDAVALAIRTGATIYTTEEVLAEASYAPEDRKENRSERSGGPADNERQNENRHGRKDKEASLSSIPEKRLKEMMAEAVEAENYEAAASIKRELDERKKKQEGDSRGDVGDMEP